MTEFEPYERVCFTAEYFDEPFAPKIYDDIKYLLMNMKFFNYAVWLFHGC